MKSIHNGKTVLCREMEEILDKDKMSAGDLENLHKLSDTYKNLLKIEMLEDEEGYSEDGMHMREPYDERGGSYRGRRGTHYVHGHYSRDSYAGDDMGARERETRMGYSRHDGKDRMLHELGGMMEGADHEQRRILERAMQEIRRA